MVTTKLHQMSGIVRQKYHKLKKYENPTKIMKNDNKKNISELYSQICLFENRRIINLLNKKVRKLHFQSVYRHKKCALYSVYWTLGQDAM